MWMKNVAVFLCILAAGVLPVTVSAQIVINELLADPATDWSGDGTVDSKNDEWIEIVNVGTMSVDLSTMHLSDASGGTTWRYRFGGTLAPGEVRVVYGSDAVAWQSANGFPTVGLSLNNGGDTVSLFRINPGDTMLVDEHTYESHAVQDDRSTGRLPNGGPLWVVFDELNPYNGTAPPEGTGCAPTPGATNACGALPAESATWGAVKDRYRD
jgi:hypothetical protein